MICFECWKDIPNYEGIYKISNNGYIMSVARNVVCKDGQLKPVNERLLSFGDNGNGYKFCYLWKDNKSKRFYVHILVASIFITNPNPKEYTEINHIDGNRSNNKHTNLEWCNHVYNINYKFSAKITIKNITYRYGK